MWLSASTCVLASIPPDIARAVAGVRLSCSCAVPHTQADGLTGEAGEGVRLLEAPHQLVSIPRLQRPAILTEDLMTEREDVLQSLGVCCACPTLRTPNSPACQA